MTKPNRQRMLELLSFILHCPVCSNKYNAEQTSIIDTETSERADSPAIIVHTDCENCKSSVVFNVSMDGPEVFSVGMVTDLTLNDAQRFKELQNVTLDEIIDFHEYLKIFNGDFQAVLK